MRSYNNSKTDVSSKGNGHRAPSGHRTAIVRGKIADIAQAAYKVLRPLLGPGTCRFHPTCSEYGFQSFKKHGLLKGVLFSASRVVRCHPWNPGGYDPVP